MKDYYAVLEVSPDASQETIKKQRRFLLQAFHPDKFPNSLYKKEADKRSKEINEAYDVLGNPDRRQEYDLRYQNQSSVHRSQEQTYQKRQAEEAEAERRRAEHERKQREQAEAERRRAEHERKQREQAEAEKRKEQERIKTAQLLQERQWRAEGRCEKCGGEVGLFAKLRGQDRCKRHRNEIKKQRLSREGRNGFMVLLLLALVIGVIAVGFYLNFHQDRGEVALDVEDWDTARYEFSLVISLAPYFDLPRILEKRSFAVFEDAFGGMSRSYLVPATKQLHNGKWKEAILGLDAAQGWLDMGRKALFVPTPAAPADGVIFSTGRELAQLMIAFEANDIATAESILNENSRSIISSSELAEIYYSNIGDVIAETPFAEVLLRGSSLFPPDGAWHGVEVVNTRSFEYVQIRLKDCHIERACGTISKGQRCVSILSLEVQGSFKIEPYGSNSCGSGWTFLTNREDGAIGYGTNYWRLARLSPLPSTSRLSLDDPFSLAGTYEGVYVCAQGITGMRLDLRVHDRNSISAVFSFYPDPSNPGTGSGKFEMEGDLSLGDGSIRLRPVKWIANPSNYAMIGLNGSIVAATSSILGTFPERDTCTSFWVTKQ